MLINPEEKFFENTSDFYSIGVIIFNKLFYYFFKIFYFIIKI